MRGDASLLFLYEKSFYGYTIAVGNITFAIKKDSGNVISSNEKAVIN